MKVDIKIKSGDSYAIIGNSNLDTLEDCFAFIISSQKEYGKLLFAEIDIEAKPITDVEARAMCGSPSYF